MFISESRHFWHLQKQEMNKFVKSSAIVRDAEDIRVTNSAKPVKLLHEFDEEIGDLAELLTIPDALNRTVENYPDRKALMFKDDITGEWTGITFSEYKKRVEKMAKVFIKLGLEPRGTVAVLAFNCVEWFISELAVMHAG